MKKQILEKIARRQSQLGMAQNPEQAYNGLIGSTGIIFSELCVLYDLTKEECEYVYFDFPE